MRDPYLYKDVPVLRNKLHIREQDLLDDAEADYAIVLPEHKNKTT